MWVYQESRMNATPAPVPLHSVPTPPAFPESDCTPEEAALLPVASETPASQQERRAAPKPHRGRFPSGQGIFLLAGAYLLGTFSAGILLAFLDAEELDVLSYYLFCWRNLFAVESTTQILRLFGAELLTVLGALTALLLLGLSSIGPVPIYFFTMLYGTGAGLLSSQLISGLELSKALLVILLSGTPTALATGMLCWFGSCALQVSSRLHAFSLGRGRDPLSAHAPLLLGQFALTAAALLPLCGMAVCLACVIHRFQ